MSDQIVVDNRDFYVITVGEVGPAGKDGTGTGGGGAAGVFITDVTPTTTGIVGSKTYKAAVPTNANLDTCMSDTTAVRVWVGCNGGTVAYSPTVDLNGTVVALTESTTKRWFTGYADLTLTAGTPNIITATSSEGDTDVATITVAGAVPAVLTATFGNYPGAQTALKAGDVIALSMTSTTDAVQFQIEASGASTTTYNPNATAGAASQNIVISGLSGSQVVRVRAKNSFGTYGNWFTTTALNLDQTYPAIGAFTVSYPATQTAIKAAETADVSATVTSFDTIAYSATGVSVPASTTYAATKTVTYASGTYVNSGTNYTISATRAANNATTVSSTLVRIAASAPTASISILGSPARLTSSPSGITYEVHINPDQVLAFAPSLNASLGAWTGSWTLVGTYWKRGLIIADSTARGSGVFSGLVMAGLANVAGSSITAGSTYTVGGFSLRTITFPAFSRVAPIGVNVSDQTKTTAQISGGNVLTRHTDNGVYTNGYYVSDSAGNYSSTGSYIGLSDSAFAGSNTTGTLTADVQETV